MTPKQTYNSIIAEKVIQSLNKRNMEGYYVKTKEEALKKALELTKEGTIVSFGGSETIREIGLIEELSKRNYSVLDRSKVDISEVGEIYHKALNADYYFMSTNAMTLDGKLINIDGNGNRLAALIYGPKNVIVIASISKIEKDEDSAIKRARNEAAPKNVIRLNKNTPCSITATCSDCTSSDCICAQIVITRFSTVKNRIKVILVSEELGF